MALPDREREAVSRLLFDFETNPKAACFRAFADPDNAQTGRLEIEDYQADVLRRIFAGQDITWRSGHGCGKTTTLAIAVIVFLLLRPRSKVGTTAPTWRQVVNLWAEIRKWLDRFALSFLFDPLTTMLKVRIEPDAWYAVGVASNRATNIEGLHGPRGKFLFVVDEAKGVADSIFDSVDGACSTGGNRVYASTPGSRTGKFYASHHGRVAPFFHQIHTSGETSARVGRAWVAQKRDEWGERSPIYIAKVRGEFPAEGDDVMFPLDYVDEAEAAFIEVIEDDRTLEDGGTPAVGHATESGLAIGCDVARFGFNATVAIGGTLRRFSCLQAWERSGIPQTAARVQGLARLWSDALEIPLRIIAVDDTGVGGGVTDQLQADGVPVTGVLFGAKPSPSADGLSYYANLKAELADRLRRAMEENVNARRAGRPGTFALLPNDKLRGQLTSLRRRYISKGVLALVDPDDPSIPREELAPGMKVSPDHAHALLLAHYAATQAVSLTTSTVIEPTPIASEVFRPRGRFGSSIWGRRLGE